ncbi:MAG: MGMT family protein [Candidatus Anstonellaceae archaeon]
MRKINIKKIFSFCKKIPKGKVSTYKYLAAAAGYKKAYRAVANLLKKSPAMPSVPCHRVVQSSGCVGGYKFGQKLKIKLLKQEGLKIKNKKILNFSTVLYNFKSR